MEFVLHVPHRVVGYAVVVNCLLVLGSAGVEIGGP